MEQIEVKDNERVVILKRPQGTGFRVGDNVRVYTQFGNASTTLFIVAPRELEVKRIEREEWKNKNG